MSADSWRGRSLGIIGAGNMAEAIARGAASANLIPGDRILAYDPLPERRELFSSLGFRSAAAAEAAGAEAILLSVKPQNLRQALEDVRGAIRPGALAMSIVAGVSTETLAKLLPSGTKIIRCMPNTPLLVGLGVSCLVRGPGAGETEMRLALTLFSAAGSAMELPEAQMDAVTALSGGGPAYLFRFAEALIAGGEALGLSSDTVRRLSAATLRGAAEMLVRGGDPAELRSKVTSRGGTTAEALKIFDSGGLMEMTARALSAARKRSEELGREA